MPKTKQVEPSSPAVGSALRNLRDALLLYHEAWNGCDGDWKAAMRAASKNAEAVLWPNTGGETRRKPQGDA